MQWLAAPQALMEPIANFIHTNMKWVVESSLSTQDGTPI